MSSWKSATELQHVVSDCEHAYLCVCVCVCVCVCKKRTWVTFALYVLVIFLLKATRFFGFFLFRLVRTWQTNVHGRNCSFWVCVNVYMCVCVCHRIARPTGDLILTLTVQQIAMTSDLAPVALRREQSSSFQICHTLNFPPAQCTHTHTRPNTHTTHSTHFFSFLWSENWGLTTTSAGFP